MDKQVSFLDQLFDQGILHDSGVDGLYARSDLFEEVITRGRETCADGYLTMIVRADSMAWLWCFERIAQNGVQVCNGSAVYALGTLYRETGDGDGAPAESE